jgi:glycosyltransferase involved in cell wall biosynthesis
MNKISIVSPVYNAEGCLEELVKQIKLYLNKHTRNFEIILVNDYSEDNSWKKLLYLKKKNKFLKIYNLKKNYGQHYAFRYGAKKATGDKIFFLDCDLEHHPKFFRKFLNNYSDNKIIVGKQDATSIAQRGFLSNIFWLIYSLVTFKNHLYISNYILISKKILKKLLQKKKITYLYGDLISLNFNCIYIKFKKMNRFEGISSYDFKKLIELGLRLLKNRNF